MVGTHQQAHEQRHTSTHTHINPTSSPDQEAPVVFPVIDGNHKATIRGHSGGYNGVPLRKAGWKLPKKSMNHVAVKKREKL